MAHFPRAGNSWPQAFDAPVTNGRIFRIEEQLADASTNWLANYMGGESSLRTRVLKTLANVIAYAFLQ